MPRHIICLVSAGLLAAPAAAQWPTPTNVQVLPDSTAEREDRDVKDRIARSQGFSDSYQMEAAVAARREVAPRVEDRVETGTLERRERMDRDPAMERSSSDHMEGRASDTDNLGDRDFGDRLVDAAGRDPDR